MIWTPQLLGIIFISILILLFVSLVLWIWLLFVPGKTYWALISSKLPWNRGKRNLIHLFSSGTMIKHIFVKKLPKNKLYKAVKSNNILQEQFIYLPEVYHLDENGTPVYIAHEYSPIGLLIKKLNLDLEVKQLEDALMLSDQVLVSKNENLKKEFILSINRLFPELNAKLTLIPRAKELVLESMYWNNDTAMIRDITDNNKEVLFNSLSINKRLEYYIDHLVRIRERIMEKNRTFITSKDLFSAISGQKYMKQLSETAHMDGFLEAMMSIKKDNIWFYIIAFIGFICIILGIMSMVNVGKINKKVTAMDLKINQIEYDTNILTHYIIPVDQNGHFITINKQQELIPTNIPNTTGK